MRALELFGGDGEVHTKDYVALVKSLDIWEIDRKHETQLRDNFPSATVRIVDSVVELQTTPNRYDLILADAPTTTYGPYCEHFELFPDVFRAMNDRAVLILNVMLNLGDEYLARYGPHEDQLARRRWFYRTETPASVPLDQMARVYGQKAAKHGFELEWHETEHRRSSYFSGLHYFVLALRRSSEG